MYYLLHGRGFELLDETLEGLDGLLRMGKISFFGVSLFSVANLEELTQVRDGVHVQTDEVPYNLLRRGIELDLLPWCRARGIPVMACPPLERGELAGDPVLRRIAQRMPRRRRRSRWRGSSASRQ